jgi:hypothetical protein
MVVGSMVFLMEEKVLGEEVIVVDGNVMDLE